MSASIFKRDCLTQPVALSCLSPKHISRLFILLLLEAFRLQCWTVHLQDSTAGTACIFSRSPTHANCTLPT